MTTMRTDARVPRPAPRRRARGHPPETLVFATATAVGIVHALDDAIVHREPGVGAGQHLLALVLAVGLGVGAIAAFPRLRPGLRAAAAFVLGALATVNGAGHAVHAAGPGPAAGDLTGLLAAAAGVVLVGLAAAVPWRHRGEGAGGRRRRWTRRMAAVPLGLLTLAAIAPMGVAVYETHQLRARIGAPPGRDYREVSFDAADGVHLAGWYRPARNGATVLVLHGGGGDRTGALAHARLLARHGYGVLLYDARGRGESDGVQNSWGWGWPKDVAGALAFLHARPEVDPARIGGLGLSTGADVLVQVAGQRSDLKAVVADGAAASSFEDAQRVLGWSPTSPFAALYFTTLGVTSGTRPGPVLDDSIRHITSPLLLISAGRPEKPFADHYARVAGNRPVEHWHLPDASHTAGIREAGPEYERRVIGFFDRTLRPG